MKAALLENCRVDSWKGKRGSSKIAAAFQALVAVLESLKVDSIKVHPKTWAGARGQEHREKAVQEKAGKFARGLVPITDSSKA